MSANGPQHHAPSHVPAGARPHEAVETARSPISGRFRDNDVEREFRRASFAGEVNRIRAVAFPAAAFYLAGIAVDALIVRDPRTLQWLVLMRLVVSTIIACSGILVARCAERPRWFLPLLDGGLLVTAAATCSIIALSPGALVLHALTVLVMLVVFYLFVPLPTLHALGVGVAFSAGFLATAHFFKPEPEALPPVLLYLALINVLGTLTVRLDHHSRRREFLVLRTERSLSARLRREVASRRSAESALADSESRFRNLVELSPDAVVVHDGNKILYSNPAAWKLVGARSPEDAGHMTVLDFVAPDDHEMIRNRMARVVTTLEALPPVEAAIRTLEGKEVLCEVVAGPTVLEGRPAIQSVIRDIGDRKALEEELRRQAFTDPLTGIANRRHFFEQIEEEFSRARRHGRPLSVLMIDVDRFKRVNDEHGHAVGDAVLCELVKAMGEILRSEDLLARIGGEEFAVVLPEIDEAGAETVADRLQTAAADVRVPSPNGDVHCTVSIGVAQAQPARESPDRALQRADEALYDEKRAGEIRDDRPRIPS